MAIVKPRPLLPLLGALAVAALAATGCATGRAQVIEESPTLAVPPVPPRAIEPQPTVEPVEIEPVAPLPTPPTSAAPPKTRASAPRPSEPKPEAKPETPPDAPPAAATPSSPATVPSLRTATTPSGPDAVKQIRETMQRAQAILARVDYQKLSEDRRLNYNAVRNFVAQAEEKIKQEDLRLAMDFATRAEIAAKTLLEGAR